MTDRNTTYSGIVLEYKFDGIDRQTIDQLCQCNDLVLSESDGVFVASRKTNPDYVVFKWFAEDLEYYSNYSVSTLKNGILKEQKIKTSGGAMSELDQNLLEAIQSIIKKTGSKQELTEAVDVDSVVDKIQKRTDANDHTGAAMVLATYLKSSKMKKILDAIESIQDAEGSIPPQIRDYRDLLVKEMVATIKDKSVADKIWGAF